MSPILHNRRPKLLKLAPDEKMPNSHLPVMIYRGVIDDGDGIEGAVRSVLSSNGWGGFWTDGIFGYNHFHSNAHEALVVISGSATLQLGGSSGTELEVNTGDALILPAGTGHRRLRASADFLVVGAYPPGQEKYDIYIDVASCANYQARLMAVPLPKADPIYGGNGPLTKRWPA